MLQLLFNYYIDEEDSSMPLVSNTAIVTRSVEFSYSQNTVLFDVNIKCGPGSICAILGMDYRKCSYFFSFLSFLNKNGG